jgi:methionine--tRNA ligase
MPHPSDSTRYITTPIFYVNDRPHIGHLYTSTLCDVYTRAMRLTGRDVFFLSGTDEHGVKVEKAAQARSITPKTLADENAAEFRRALTGFAITNDHFIRTTDPEHERQVQAFVAELLKRDAVYLGEFEGWYDEGQEEYYTETKAKDLNYASPVSKKPLTRAKEHNYYFRLSKFQKPLEEFFAKNPKFVQPEARRNEVLGRLREGLQDVPISRTNFTWGIAMPNDPKHVIYVWIDALFNYITALGLGEPADNPIRKQREHYWPATYHVIGKEILWFHAVIWPAILMSLDLPLPKCVYAHSFWISEGQKMSKSLGNFIDLAAINRYVQTYGLDAWRWYLVTQGPLGATDANFAGQHFHEMYHADLVNTVGNCASRVTAMIGKYFDGVVPADSGAPVQVGKTPGPARTVHEDWPIPNDARNAVERCIAAMDRFDLCGAASEAVNLLRRVDAFINATEPFKVAKDPTRKNELASILYQCAESVRIASILLSPILVTKMPELWTALGLPSPLRGAGRGAGGEGGREQNQPSFAQLTQWGGLKPGTKVQKVALYPRVEAAPAAATVAAPMPVA